MKKYVKFFISAGFAAAAALGAATVAFAANTLVPTFSVWANGRDIKDNTKTPENEERRYKTGVYQHYCMSSGGKWNVAVTEPSVSTIEEFVKLVDPKGKFVYAMASETKQIATAKIKDGEITVTAGKKGGTVNIWVYESNKNGLVYIPEYGIEPKVYAAEVKVSSGTPVLAAVGDIKDGLLKTGANAVTKLTLPFNSEENAVQTATALALGDKKDIAAEASSYTITYSNSDKSTGASIVSALLSPDNSTVYITPVSVGKATLMVTNNQSGKAAKLSIEVRKKYAVTFNSEEIGVVDMTNKNSPVEVFSGDDIIDGSTLKITAMPGVQVDQIVVAGKNVKSGGTVKMNGAPIDIKSGRVYPVTMSGSDKNNTVKDGTKAIKNGAAFIKGAKLTVVLENGVKATAKTGDKTVSYTGNGTDTFELEIDGNTTIEFVKPAAS